MASDDQIMAAFQDALSRKKPMRSAAEALGISESAAWRASARLGVKFPRSSSGSEAWLNAMRVARENRPEPPRGYSEAEVDWARANADGRADVLAYPGRGDGGEAALILGWLGDRA